MKTVFQQAEHANSEAARCQTHALNFASVGRSGGWGRLREATQWVRWVKGGIGIGISHYGYVGINRREIASQILSVKPWIASTEKQTVNPVFPAIDYPVKNFHPMAGNLTGVCCQWGRFPRYRGAT
jgi:hypothetical protein